MFPQVKKGGETVKWFKVYAEKWFMGSSRFELTVEQRAIWIDLLAKASMNEPPGQIDYYSLEQLSHIFVVPLDLLKTALKRCEETTKVKHDTEKKMIVIVNWRKYQSEYQRQVPYRKKSKQKLKSQANADISSNNVTRRGKGEEEKEKKAVEEEEKTENLSDPLMTLQPVSSHPTSLEKEKRSFLILLSKTKNIGYPFNEFDDAVLYDELKKNYPSVNILQKTKKKIDWWEDQPRRLENDPREQLRIWIREDYKALGAERIGNLIPEVMKNISCGEKVFAEMDKKIKRNH